MRGRKGIPFILCLAVLVLLAAAVGYIYFIRLYNSGFANDAMLTLTSRSGRLELSWDKLGDQMNDGYVVEIYDAANGEALNTEPIYSMMYRWWDVMHGEEECALLLPEELSINRPLTFYVNSVKTVNVLGKELCRKGKTPLIAAYSASGTESYAVDYSVNPTESEITFTFEAGCPGVYRLYLQKEGSGLANPDYTDVTLDDMAQAEGGNQDDLTETNGDAEINGLTGTDNAGGIQGQEILDEMSVDGGMVNFKELFGQSGFAVPRQGEKYIFSVACVNDAEHLIVKYESITLDREEFLTDQVNVFTEKTGENRYTLTWNETKGDGYTISLWNDDKNKWQDIIRYSLDEDRVFDTGRLAPCKEYRYRIEAIDPPADVSEEDGMEEITLHTSPAIEYANVWPTQELPIYEDSTGDDQIGSIGVLQAVSVLEEKDGRFLIQTGIGDDSIQGYIDSNKCMINLPDYIGDLCKYDITNSYSSIYLAHEYGIPAVSGTVISGYENVLLSDGTFLVPLLYPVAKKLVPAAEEAREKEYIIVIYDSFRPYVATRSIYDLTYAALYYEAPENPFTRISLKEYEKGVRANVIELSSLKKVEPKTEETTEESKKKEKNTKSKKKKSQDDEEEEDVDSDSIDSGDGLEQTGAQADNAEAVEETNIIEEADTVEEVTTEATTEKKKKSKSKKKENKEEKEEKATTTEAVEEEEHGPTYADIMLNNGAYNLGAFLAAKGSMHNLGVAMDMTIEDAETDKELVMQSNMHDLSFHSIQAKNNDNANILKNIMVPHGFYMITSEWWHFQDNDVRNELQPVSIQNGVSIEGWKKDENGWRYEKADGSFYKNTSETIGNESYSFDGEGYVK